MPWSGQDAGKLAAGVYQVRLRAASRDAQSTVPAADLHEQAWEIEIGALQAPKLPRFSPLAGRPPGATAVRRRRPPRCPTPFISATCTARPTTATAAPSSTDCKGAQEPLEAKYGPDAAFGYARAHGLDILVASEHNHMYDGSAGSPPDADPAAAKALYRKGLDIASSFNAAHPDFLAVYGMEWGVINKGGHLNIFNSDQLLGWEKNARASCWPTC